MVFTEEKPAPRLDKNGHEIPDPTPMVLPTGFRKPEMLADTVARLVRRELSDRAAAAGAETFEEADDFDVGDDFDPSSPYEQFFDAMLGRDISVKEFQQNPERYKAEVTKKVTDEFKANDKAELLKKPSWWFRRKKEAGDGGAQPPSDKQSKDAQRPPPSPGEQLFGV